MLDYNGVLEPQGKRAEVGDIAVFGFRNQAVTTRAYSAAIRGLHAGTPQLMGLFDCAAHRVTRLP